MYDFDAIFYTVLATGNCMSWWGLFDAVEAQIVLKYGAGTLHSKEYAEWIAKMAC